MKTHTLIFSSTTRRFTLAESLPVALAMVSMGNADGFNRVCKRIPAASSATLQTVGRVTTLTFTSPNGETLTTTGGRVELKRIAYTLRAMGATFYNVPKSGVRVEVTA